MGTLNLGGSYRVGNFGGGLRIGSGPAGSLFSLVCPAAAKEGIRTLAGESRF